jgi:hypothetical protein
MSYFIIDINTDFDINKIIIGTPITLNDELVKVYIYYLDENIPKEIILKIPPLRLIYSYKNLKFNQIKLPIYPIWDNTTKFIKLVKKIEKYVRINVNCDKGIFVNSIEKSDKLTTLKMNITQNVKISSPICTSIYDLKINGEIETLCNISYVWIKKTSYGLSLSCCQIKYTPRIDELEIDFFDVKKPNIIKKEIINIPEKKENNIKPMLLLNTSILNDAITKLNKVKN